MVASTLAQDFATQMAMQISSAPLALAAGFSLSVGACGTTEDAGDEVDELFNCAVICQAFADCENVEGFDVSGCTADCEDMSDLSDAFEEQAEACQACIDADACEANEFQCDDACVGIVP